MQVLNFYSTIFADQLKRGRKTATIRLGDKSHKYKKNQAVLVTIGYQHSPREKIFEAVIDQVDVKRVKDLSPRDIEHDNPEFRRHDEMIHFLEQIYGREVSMEDIVTVVRFSQIIEHPPSVTDARLVEKLGDIRYWYMRGGRRIAKVVSFFLLDYVSGELDDHDHEVEHAEWMTLEEAARRLTYQGERDMAAAALSRRGKPQ